MIERMDLALPISQQCRLLALPRSSVYRTPATVSAEELAIMALIDRHYLARPYYGSRRMAAWPTTQGHRVNRKRVQRLMRLLGLAAIYQRPNTSKPAEAHKIYPYLLRGLAIERVNQVWCSDVTYISMAKGFLYLVAIMDWVSRAVLAWRVSNTLGTDFRVEALEEALSRYGRPEIFNTDQGSQFTSDDFTGTLTARPFSLRPTLFWRPTRSAMSARRLQSSSPKQCRRRSTLLSGSRCGTSRCPRSPARPMR
jgi:putative transposase